MDYQFEALGDERFQKLCQSLLVLAFPNVICYPVGMPDGGRDAAVPDSDGKQVVIFQVKFVRDPSTKEARDSVVSAIKSEAEKVKRLKERGASEYYLLTNVQGSSHLDSGSMDRAEKALSEELDIKSRCWWREDLTARLNAHPQIKWSFLELLKGGDILEKLIGAESRSEENARRTVDSYVSSQWVRDRQLKFKQANLENALLGLFTDVPAKIVPSAAQERSGQKVSLPRELQECGIEPAYEYDAKEGTRRLIVGAMQLLGNAIFCERHAFVVLEGAPGQGKSTVTQYLCQIHRLLLLGKAEDLRLVPGGLVPAEVRIPFRIDLRDYAAWLSGKNPFSENYLEPLLPGTSPVLERFIVAQICRLTGADFSVEDFRWIAAKSRILIVLDGFDEVADVSIRNRIIAEARESAVRLRQGAISCQMIVTSRPTAFVNSPGFPRDDWDYMELLPLSRDDINLYADRWLAAKGTDPRESQEIRRALSEGIGHAHVRDLARNPMQLSILLTLINVQGVSLPNKRTSLYDKYIDVFLNRESEKSDVIRNNRDLILQLHGYIAWKLQVDAENNGAGNVSSERLRLLVKDYLERHGHPVDALDDLFLGVTERVVALVSRVQGTYEFEVQPLREYFAARFIYDSAPYVVASMDAGGTKPDRFRALSKNFFWRNVLRFYAGCYSSGELASIVEGLAELEEEELSNAACYSARLGFELLTDYVFTNQPRLAEKVLDSLTNSRSLMAFASTTESLYSGRRYLLPEGPARERLRRIIVDELGRHSSNGYRQLMLSMLALNSDVSQMTDYIHGVEQRRGGPIRLSMLANTGLIYQGEAELLTDLVVDDEPGYARALFGASRFDVLSNRPSAVGSLAADLYVYPYPLMGHLDSIPKDPELLRLMKVACVYTNYRLFSVWGADIEMPLDRVLWPFLTDERLSGEVKELMEELPDQDSNGTNWSAFDSIFRELQCVTVSGLMANLDLLERTFEIGFRIFGPCFLTNRFGLLIASVAPAEHVGASPFDSSASLLQKCKGFYALHEDGYWREMVEELRVQPLGDDFELVVTAVVRLMPAQLIIECAEIVSSALAKLDVSVARAILTLVVEEDDDRLSEEIDVTDEKLMLVSPLLALFLKARVHSKVYARIWRVVMSEAVSDIPLVSAEIISRWISECVENGADWSQAVIAIRENYIDGTPQVYLEDESALVNPTVPEDIALAVVAEPSRYPPIFVYLCVSRIDSLIGERCIGVSRIAQHQCWPE